MSDATLNARTIAARDVPEQAVATKPRRRSKLLRPLLMLGGVAVVAAASLTFWINGGRIVSIDNAYVRADKLSLATDVSGLVATIPVHEGEAVQRNDVLFRLDDRQFSIALTAAQANLAQTRLQLDAMKRDYERMLRDVGAKQAQVGMDQARFDRVNGLVGRGDISRQSFDDARFQLLADQQGYESAKVAAQVQLAKLGGDANADVTSLPAYKQMEAQVAETQRQLDHTVVRAPMAGVVTGVSALQPGVYLPSGTAAFGLVSTESVWVEANPKETELTWVRPGDAVSMTIDAYPGRAWTGAVDSIAPASGSEFSILPAQNSSGNWVKVVQRISMRVRVDHNAGDPPLRAGMSVVADVDTGHARSWHDLF